MEIQNVELEFPADTNIILGQSHFIKTVEDLYEIMVTTVPGARFGVAFSEASGPRLVRAEGNDEELKQLAIKNVMALAAGHCFLLIMREAYPINVLHAFGSAPKFAESIVRRLTRLRSSSRRSATDGPSSVRLTERPL